MPGPLRRIGAVLMTAPNVSRVYSHAGHVAHEVTDSRWPYRCYRCGRRPTKTHWLGTRSPAEREKAARLPLCIGDGRWRGLVPAPAAPTVGDDLL